MTKSYTKILVLLTFSFLYIQNSFCFQRVCYYTNWSQYRVERGYGFFPEDIDPKLCTHIIYAFGKIENNDIVNYEENDITIDGKPGMYKRIMKLKEKNNELKIMIALGGWNAGSYPFDQVTKDDNTTSLFAKNAVTFLRKWDFDGLDIDWEYPTLKKVAFTKFLEALKLEFELNALLTGSDRLLLSAAVGAGQATIDTSYEVDRLNEILDFMNLMTYDLHGSWEIKTGFHTALYPNSGEKDWERTLNVNWVVNYFIKKGMSRSKIMLGLGLYGRSFNLRNATVNAVGSPSMGPSAPGKIVMESGILAYYEICTEISKGAVKSWNDEQKSASIQFNTSWIGYDDEKAIGIKVEYALSNCLGGIMTWALDLDDFKGKFCNAGPYPLMNKILKTVKAGTNVTCVNVTTKATTSVTQKATATTRKPTPTIILNATVATTTATKSSPVVETTTTIAKTPELEVTCNNETELLTDIDDCTSFYVCLSGIEKPLARLHCPSSMWFDITVNTCVAKMPTRCKPLVISSDDESKTNLERTTELLETEPTTDTTPSTILTATDTTEGTIDTTLDTTTNIITDTTTTTTDTTTTTTQTTVLQTTEIKTTKMKLTAKTTTTENLVTTEISDQKSDGEFKCPQPFGLHPQPDCTKFISCSNNIANYKTCPTGLVYNDNKKTCDYTSPQCPKYNFYKKTNLQNDETSFACPKQAGLYRNPRDCSTFWNCADNIQVLMQCPPTLLFNSETGVCDFKSDCILKFLGNKKRSLRREI